MSVIIPIINVLIAGGVIYLAYLCTVMPKG
jgi:hypothetical protein